MLRMVERAYDRRPLAATDFADLFAP